MKEPTVNARKQSLPVPSEAELALKARELLQWFQQFSSCAVAFSGGTDSTLVAFAATHVLGSQTLVVTADSPSLARHELVAAQQLAEQFGFRHQVVKTAEMEQAGYRANVGNRCYFCKDELYRQLERLYQQFDGLTAEASVSVVVNGANCDDLGDHRPGMVAAEEHAVRSPLIECRFSKSDVRDLAACWGLPNCDKPASPCLSSRLAYGVEVTPERLSAVERGEAVLRGLGLREFRLRVHAGDLARIEVPLSELARLTDPRWREPLVAQLQQLGFRFVTLDLAGFRSGSLNVLVPAEELMLGIDRLRRTESSHE